MNNTEMGEENEKRVFTRFDNSFEGDQKSPLLLVTVPALAEGPIHPEDFSSGGFRLLLPKPPVIGSELDCTVRVYDISISGLKGRVSWVEKIEAESHSWNVGLSIDISEGERDVLSSLMTSLLSGETQDA